MYQVLPIDKEVNLIIGWEILSITDQIWLKLTCFKDKAGHPSKSEEHIIYLEAINTVLKLIASKDVIPNDKPLKLIRDFKEYVRLFIFSFILYYPEAAENEGEESIQIKCSTIGLLDKEVQIKFWKKQCSIVFKYIKDRTFRITLYIVGDTEGAFEHGLSIDVKCDLFSYNQFYSEIDIDKIIERNMELDKNLFVTSHNLVEGKYSIKRLETSKLKYIIFHN